MFLTDEGVYLRNTRQRVTVFIPFAPLITRTFYALMPLKWISLFISLEILCAISFYLNFIASDFVWCSLAIVTYVMLTTTIYMNGGKNGVVKKARGHQKLIFSNLFRVCAKAAFSDYRVSLVSRIPLVLQVLAGGSLLYAVFGADWIMHFLAGFGIGALALKAYVAGVGYYGYNRLASYFHLDRFRIFRAERKTASAEFTLFSIIVVALLWEVFERTVHFISPMNVLRIGAEPLWNISGDVLSAVAGGMLAWYLLTKRFKVN